MSSSRNPPPWRNHQPSSTIPAKRSANSRAHNENPPKRSIDAREEAWIADEDRFVLQQAKKKAALRVKSGRAKPIDWLAVTLRFVDPTKTMFDEEIEDHELDIVDPEGVLEGLGDEDFEDLEKEIENYLTLETNRNNRDYWNTAAASLALQGKLVVPAPFPPTSTACSHPKHTNSWKHSKNKSRQN
ncbi:unnamed protein product [Periconia digitata]|uniref:Splicing factor cactin central domain-containing protein n=1 Tax=Periconia digitata TaxID=1303443 RepID=A0A9W4XK05_9PLEO|nr:unnamed protein product [Periconia digitata]